MDTRKHETRDAASNEWGSEPFSWLRKRNERRARVAQVMQDTQPRRVRAIPVQREHDRRHGR
jgi:hypothetical protein